MLSKVRWAAAASLMMLAAAAPVRAQGIAYYGSIQYSTGDYIFAERTSTLYLFNGVTWSRGRASGGASWPLILQDSPWVSYTGSTWIPSGGPRADSVQSIGTHKRRHDRKLALVDSGSVSELGFGDPSAYVSVDLLSPRVDRPTLRLTGGLKAPVADVENGFGTGAWDYHVGVSASYGRGRGFIFGDLSYWFLGDMEELELQDPVTYSLSVGRTFGSNAWGLLLSYSGSTRIIDGTEPPRFVTLGISRYLANGRALSATTGFGLSEVSPDFSASLGWRIPF